MKKDVMNTQSKRHKLRVNIMWKREVSFFLSLSKGRDISYSLSGARVLVEFVSNAVLLQGQGRLCEYVVLSFNWCCVSIS